MVKIESRPQTNEPFRLKSKVSVVESENKNYLALRRLVAKAIVVRGTGAVVRAGSSLAEPTNIPGIVLLLRDFLYICIVNVLL